ncbi:golgi transport 1 A family protein [Acanthamoeba castellanii str. Neff]|uniref:Golgi transport 1 A family protein n=1 Tax=Acanthamoeba castellanii (strain ATCC 30010 / Neff) TaxID=1257118 RepID=L8GIG7_ACACF|nr:golgi transport 1 A family protein [Acanthamoeba castellanii str. Neff]ELR12619.1 golgi transport 1 A family protein [Acanthamoeba castellanii str. Neff]
MLTLSDTQKVGLVMTSFGAFCTAFGILLMMDRGLLALGNVCTHPLVLLILFVTGSVLLVGLDRASSFFLEQSRLKGSVCFFGGIVFVLIKWPILGLLVEVFGFVNLFG